MEDNLKDRQSIYELGYLIASNISEGDVPRENDHIRKVIIDNEGIIISEENAKSEQLAYTIRKKTTAGTYDKFNMAYFGWIKFETDSSLIDKIKKTVEALPSILRILVISTVRENTYIGKRGNLPNEITTEIKESIVREIAEVPTIVEAQKPPIAPASIEEMDKSIDEMVKEI